MIRVVSPNEKVNRRVIWAHSLFLFHLQVKCDGGEQNSPRNSVLNWAQSSSGQGGGWLVGTFQDTGRLDLPWC